MINTLNWDTDFFNKKVGEIRVPVIDINHLEYLDRDEFYDVVYVFVERYSNLLEEIIFNNNRLRLVDIKTTFHKKVDSSLMIPYHSISIFKERNIPESLYELAIDSGIYSRFRIDENFSDQEFENLYRKWIENSVHDQKESIVLAAYSNDDIIGVITAKLGKTSAKVGLLSVHRAFRGKGLGRRLIYALEVLLNQRSITDLYIPTQRDNKVACQFYNRIGLDIKEELYVLHYWR